MPVMVPSLDTPKLRSRADQLRADQSGRDEIPGSQRAEGGPWAMLGDGCHGGWKRQNALGKPWRLPVNSEKMTWDILGSLK